MKLWMGLLAAVSTFISGFLFLGPAHAQQKFPTRPVEINVWASAGGGTDIVNRLIAKAMEKELRGSIVVSNRTGGGGAIAMNHVWSRPHDGYNWLGSSEQMQITAVMVSTSTDLDGRTPVIDQVG